MPGSTSKERAMQSKYWVLDLNGESLCRHSILSHVFTHFTPPPSPSPLLLLLFLLLLYCHPIITITTITTITTTSYPAHTSSDKLGHNSPCSLRNVHTNGYCCHSISRTQRLWGIIIIPVVMTLFCRQLSLSPQIIMEKGRMRLSFPGIFQHAGRG